MGGSAVVIFGVPIIAVGIAPGGPVADMEAGDGAGAGAGAGAIACEGPPDSDAAFFFA